MVDWTTMLNGGTLVTIVGSVIMYWWQKRSEHRAVRAAILAEMRVLVELIEDREYISDLLKAEQNPTPISVPVPDGYDLVFRENASRLGCLGSVEAEKIVRFYKLLLAVIADVRPGGALYQGTDSPEAFAEARKLLEEAVKIAREMFVEADEKKSCQQKWASFFRKLTH